MEQCPAETQSSPRSKTASAETPTDFDGVIETADGPGRLDEDRANSMTDEGGPGRS